MFSKNERFVLASRKGSILIYVLVFFVFFVGWYEGVIRIKVQNINRHHLLTIIDKKLDIELRIITAYRGTERVKYDFSLHNTSIITYKNENTVYVRALGDIRMHFKYDIIEDGSFKYSQWEE